MINRTLIIVFLLIFNINIFSQSIDSIITKESLQQTVGFLSHDSLKGRLTGSESMITAANFIAENFKSIGLSPTFKDSSYFNNYSFKFEGKKINGINVIGVLTPTMANDTAIIISAHYDHVGQGDDVSYNKEYIKEDDIFNGANDNATGVAAMIELAKYYTAKKDNRYTLLFVAFSGEELGLEGSSHLAKQIKPKLIKAVINLEMLGRPSNGKCFITALNKTKIRKRLNEYLKNNNQEIKNNFFENDPYPEEMLFYRSDHYPFTKRIKNAFTIMATSPKDQYYHSEDDEYSTIDFYFLLTATKNIAIACEYFIQ